LKDPAGIKNLKQKDGRIIKFFLQEVFEGAKMPVAV
jgi:hypothetical protein